MEDDLRNLLRSRRFLVSDYNRQKSALNRFLIQGLEKNDLIRVLVEELSLKSQASYSEEYGSQNVVGSSKIKTIPKSIPDPLIKFLGSHNDTLRKHQSTYDSKLIVYILGAGPVGLMTAIKLADLFKSKVNVVFLEKREVYTRERVLFVNKHIIKDIMPKQLLTKSKMAKYGCSLPALPSQDLASCASVENLGEITRLAISTRVLEDDLKELLDSPEYNSNVNFIYNENMDQEFVENLNKLYTPHVFVGADGGNLSTKLYPNQHPAGDIVRELAAATDCLDDNDQQVPCGIPITTYGLVVQFLPEPSDTKFTNNQFPKRQNRYRVFRQQYKTYQKFNSKEAKANNTPTVEPLGYYIAVQLNKAERDHIIKEMGGEAWLKTYSLGDDSTQGKYLDRLIYDASKIYNFDLKPGRVMNGVAVFELDVTKQKPDNYSRVISVINTKGEERYIWALLIGDAILSVNFFSGTGVNAGFAMIDIFLKALSQLLPVEGSADLFGDTIIEKKMKDAGYTPTSFKNLSPYIRKDIVGGAKETTQKLPIPLEILKPEIEPGQLASFKDKKKLEILVESYKSGLDKDLDTGSFDTEDIPGMNRLLSANTMFSYLDYSTMINYCNSEPKGFNRLVELDKENGIEIEMVDLEQPVDNQNLNDSAYGKVYTKASDRFCLVSHGVWGPDGP